MHGSVDKPSSEQQFYKSDLPYSYIATYHCCTKICSQTSSASYGTLHVRLAVKYNQLFHKRSAQNFLG